MVKPTAVLTGADGGTAPIAVGTVTVKRDTAKPKSAVTKPKRPVTAVSTDWSDRAGTTAKVTQKFTRA
ncbi:hypothetical protein DMB66_20825 [Actinoplanes sp. ATCC 53533]|uniref:hypothetical protein n=1 Tax=Actinoplanes sp. ATCC 53533 TaxID=1288362 RepID=UPI000F7838B6|nr:hypothetical protein [Actinoplanes sp. ATCC 53533]RSM64344.1 hypothetical protein DMB66_20825 [Actinoplanes sp. ATCC 53533]